MNWTGKTSKPNAVESTGTEDRNEVKETSWYDLPMVRKHHDGLGEICFAEFRKAKQTDNKEADFGEETCIRQWEEAGQPRNETGAKSDGAEEDVYSMEGLEIIKASLRAMTELQPM